MDAVVLRLWIFRVCRFGVAVAGVFAFWWFASPRLSQPSWVFAVLPGALLGAIAAFGETVGKTISKTGRSKWFIAAILVGSAFSTLLGQWFPEYARLCVAEERRVTTGERRQIESALAAIAMSAKEEDEGKRAEGNVVPTMNFESIPRRGRIDLLSTSLQFTRDHFSHDWLEWLASGSITVFAAIKVSRMMTRK